MTDYYNILGVSKNSSSEEIKKAYKTLAKKHHPDLNQGNKESEHKFKEINEAYSTLGDETKRANYDRFGTSDNQQQQYSQGFQGQDFSDVFESFFGNSRRSSGNGRDLKYEMEIDFLEACFGCSKEINVSKYEKCDTCSGLGGSGEEICSTCKGSGIIQKSFRTPFGVFAQKAPCSSCRGLGRKIKNTCKECKGVGRIKKARKMNVKIPAGVFDGSTLKLSGEGEAGEFGRRSGDLYVEIYVKPHEIFARKEDDIYLEFPISISQAALGDVVKIPTIRGEVKMTVPSGIQSGTVMKLKEEGVDNVNGYSRGDQLVKIQVKTPQKLSAKQKKLLEEFALENKEKLKVDKNWFEKFKEDYFNFRD